MHKGKVVAEKRKYKLIDCEMYGLNIYIQYPSKRMKFELSIPDELRRDIYITG